MNQRTFFIAVAILLIVIAAAIGYTSAQLDPREREAENASATAPAEMNEQLARICASPAAYDRLKQALFAQAIRLRPEMAPQLQTVGASSVARMEDPLLIGRDDRLNVTVCTGRLVLELPPGAERAFGGQRRFVSDIRYTAQPAADGSGLVYRLEGADRVLQQLAALQVPARQIAPPPSSAMPSDEPRASGEPTPSPEPETEPSPQTNANPSFNCAQARTRSERMVCASPALAAKDRAMSNFFYSALEDADASQRRALQRTRNNFLAYRDRCPDEACVSQAYDGRMREIRDIMRGIY
jgi:hypothetical protein